MTTTSKVLAAISGVMHDIGAEGISKDRKNLQQGYSFRGIDDVYNALSPMLAKHKLVIMPDVEERNVVERTTQKGGVIFYVTVRVRWTISSAEDGSSVEAVTYGEAMDSADKATNKAMSAAYKYMAMMAFCIPTEGDNDADTTTHDVAPRQDRPPPRDRSPEGLAVTAAESAIIMCMTEEELKEWGDKNAEMIKGLPKPQSTRIRNSYGIRLQALKAEAAEKAKAAADDPFNDEIPF